MYKEKDKKKANGYHTYAVYKDGKTNKYRAIQLTHLIDKKKVSLIEKGYLKIEKFSTIKYPSGVHNTYYDTYVNGKPLNFGKNSKHKLVGTISTKQANRIKKFANKKHK